MRDKLIVIFFQKETYWAKKQLKKYNISVITFVLIITQDS